MTVFELITRLICLPDHTMTMVVTITDSAGNVLADDPLDCAIGLEFNSTEEEDEAERC